MARIRLASEVEAEREKAAQYKTGSISLDLSRLALLYGRQSTVKQTVYNIQSALEQSEGLENYAIMLGWVKEAKRILLVENSVAKKRNQISGALRIDQRPGLSTVCGYIDAGEASAVIAEDVSRLFRDETTIEAATFAAKCKAANCVVITTTDGYIYDFNNPYRDDTKKFIEEALEAGAWRRKHVFGKMLKNRAKKAERGKLANGVVPVGLMRKYALNEKGVLKGDDLMPSPHREQVVALYQRFQELGANHTALLREVVALAQRGIPWFPVVDGIDHKTMKLTTVYRDAVTKAVKRERESPNDVLIGWTVMSLSGLKTILSNPAYDGHLVWNGVVVKRDAHEAIVPHDLWQFGYDSTAINGLDGQPIARGKKTVRYQQKDTAPTTALMAGTRYNGKPVIDGVNGAHVYVMANTQSYIIRRLKGKHTVHGFETGIHIVDLDRIVEEKLLQYVRIVETVSAWCEELGRGVENRTTIDGVPLKQFTVHAALIDTDNAMNAQEQRQVPQAPTRLDTINNELRQVQRDLNEAGDVMDMETRRAKYARIAELKYLRVEEEKRVEGEAIKAEQLKQAQDDVKVASKLWEKWPIARRQRFMRVATDSITLQEIADGWIKLTVVWSAVLGGKVEHCYIWRPNGSLWTEYEKEVLRVAFPGASRKTLLYMLPKRSWTAIKAKAKYMGIERTVSGNDSDLPENLSISDRWVVSAYGLKLTHTEVAALPTEYENAVFVEKPGIEPVQWVSGQICNGVTCS